MKIIRCKRNNDCGVASLAMIAGISYRKAMKILHPEMFGWFFIKRNCDASTPLGDLIAALDKLGIKNTHISNTTDNYHTILKKKSIMIMKVDGKDFHAMIWRPDLKRALDSNVGYIGKYYLRSAILIED
jgi:ABC-type bacteriocin/lantibiotic exporter with double-glycine peptidase domain